MTTPPTPDLPVLDRPAQGLPPVTSTQAGLERAIAALQAGTGPLAIDTERAQGFRYSAKAYLIQLRRTGAGTVLLDPTAFERGRPRADFTALATALGDTEWILHAATQDLPCLSEVDLLPQHLFDTELAARLLNIPRVNLGAITELALGIRLRKEHSAADWSRRPLPEEWLIYAALDVELLDQLRDWLIEQLAAAGKTEWARQEFEYLVKTAGHRHPQHTDPWRRTSGLHTLRSSLGLALVRELWQVRDQLAQEQDRAPGRILNDRAITELAHRVETNRKPLDRLALREIKGFTARRAIRSEQLWLDAIRKVFDSPAATWPPRHPASNGTPAPRTWEHKWPEAFARWRRVRPALIERAEQLELPVENLLSPDIVRNLLWQAPEQVERDWVEHRLAEFGARPWQAELTAECIQAVWESE